MFFKDRKTITVNGTYFDLMLVEGGKFRIGTKEVEHENFQTAEIPVKQELYMTIMDQAHTWKQKKEPSYIMM